MADFLRPRERSLLMGKIRGKNTKIEKFVYAYLRRERVYFQKHYRTRFGIVLDVALPRKKKAVFIDGDFWHGRTVDKVRERRGHDDFWTKKMERNIERDQQQNKALKENGWTYIRVWESELTAKTTQGKILEKIKSFLSS